MTAKELHSWLRRNGYTLVTARSGHLKVYSADGAMLGSIPATPRGGRRSVQNSVADLRRAGIPIPRKGQRHVDSPNT